MDRFFGLDAAAPAEEGMRLLASLFNPISLSIAEEILSENGVPFLKKERGSGGLVRLIAGFQTFGTDLFVLAEHFERATELLEPLLAESVEGENADSNDQN